jgi:hypothetical protein
MSDESTLFTIQWGDELMHLAQQTKSLLEDTVTIKTGVVGERTTMNQVASKALARRTARHAPINASDPDLRRRWITMFDYDDATLFDKQDELKTLLDPKNAFNQSLIMGANRVKDDLIIAAVSETAYIGKDGTTTQAITETIAHASLGLTQAKIREANRTFEENNVDPDEPKFLIIGPKDHEDLLKLTEVTSRDFNDKPVLVKGRVTEWMGFKIIVSNRLSTASSVTKCLAYTKSGMGLALALQPSLEVSRRNDLTGLPWQAYCAISAGSTRLEEGKVIEVSTYHA